MLAEYIVLGWVKKKERVAEKFNYAMEPCTIRYSENIWKKIMIWRHWNGLISEINLFLAGQRE